MQEEVSTVSTSVRQLPAMPRTPLLGNLLELRRHRLEFFLRMSRECGDIACLHAGTRPVVFVNSPEYIHTILVERAYDFEKTPNMRKYLRPVLGNGLLTSDNEFHKRQRKLVAPAFQHRRVATYAGVMASYAERAQTAWTDGATIDIAQEMMRLTLMIVSKVLLDAELAQEADELGEALTTAMRFTIDKFSAIVQVPPNWPTAGNRRFQQARERLDSTIYRIIEERRRSGEDPGDLLSMLLRAQDEDDGSFMNDVQVRDEVMSTFVAGYETVANALAWTWYLLARHPEVYGRLREEATRVLEGRTPTAGDLASLPYTFQVFKEAMRLYPPAWTISREAKRPTKLGDYLLPVGQVVIMSPYTLHRRPDYFPEPERFDPERFTPEAEQRLPRDAYIPFADGPRGCIGIHFAMLEGPIILATLAQRAIFNLIPGQQVEPEPLITLRPRGGIKVAVEKIGY